MVRSGVLPEVGMYSVTIIYVVRAHDDIMFVSSRSMKKWDNTNMLITSMMGEIEEILVCS